METVTGVAVAGDDDLPCPHHAAGGAQQMARPVAAPLQDRRGAMELGALALGGPRQAAAVFERVEREALVMQQRAVSLAADQVSLLQLALAQHLAVQAEELLELTLACHHLADAVGTMRQLEPAFGAAVHIQLL